jgi:hypothetical protein
MKIEEGKTRLTVQHKGKNLTFIYPKFKGIYFYLQEQIERVNLKCPTMSQTVSLIHDVFNSEEEYSKEIKKLMKNSWFYTFTGNLYVPNKGVYIQDNPKTKNWGILMEESELVKKLEKNDSSVRFVPFGFKIGEMSTLELAKNQYIIGLVGEEGANKLAEIADKYKPYLWSFKKVNEKSTKISVLDFGKVFDDNLGINGLRGVCSSGYAFGIQE